MKAFKKESWGQSRNITLASAVGWRLEVRGNPETVNLSEAVGRKGRGGGQRVLLSQNRYQAEIG